MKLKKKNYWVLEDWLALGRHSTASIAFNLSGMPTWDILLFLFYNWDKYTELR